MWIFWFDLQSYRVAVQERDQNSKRWMASVRIFFSKYDFEAVLATFFCYDYKAVAFEAVEKITIDRKDYHA